MLRDQHGQASVELVAAVPFVLAVGATAWQLALVGHTAWLAAQSARAGARAQAVGRDARGAARSVLPEALERGLSVRTAGRSVRVRVRVPLLLWRSRSPLSVGAASSLGGPGP